MIAMVMSYLEDIIVQSFKISSSSYIHLTPIPKGSVNLEKSSINILVRDGSSTITNFLNSSVLSLHESTITYKERLL